MLSVMIRKNASWNSTGNYVIDCFYRYLFDFDKTEIWRVKTKIIMFCMTIHRRSTLFTLKRYFNSMT